MIHTEDDMEISEYSCDCIRSANSENDSDDK